MLIYNFNMELKLKLVFSVLCAILTPLKSQTANDQYIVTSDQLGEFYMYKGNVTSLTQSLPIPIKQRLNGTRWIRNIDVDVANTLILCLDLESSCVYSIKTFASIFASANRLKCGISRSVGSTFAYDWITGNMYWSDGIMQWIAVQPLFSTDDQVYRIIVPDVKRISTMAIDPINRYIFWYDDSPSGQRIERASLSGQKRKAILTNGHISVYDIIADITSRRIFWVDYDRYSIESANYEGSDRKVLYKGLGSSFFALAVDQEYVCATVPRYESWRCVHKLSGDLKSYKDVEPRKPFGIAMFNKAIQPQDKPNFCASATCQHFCVNGEDGAICMCQEGYTLNQDGKSCSAAHGLLGKGIVVAFDKQICSLDFRSVIHGNVNDFKCVHTGLQGVEHLQINAAEHVAYYYDSIRKHIESYNLRSSIYRTIRITTGNVSDLSFDWRQRKLYWCESDTGIIGRLSVQNYNSEVFHDSDKEVTCVSVDPYNRTVFWIEGKSKVLSSKMDDGQNTYILNEGGTKSGLFFDVVTDRLFWIQDGSITSTKTDGSVTKTYKSITQSDKLVIFKSYFVWISGKHTIQTLPVTSDHSITRTVTLPDKGTITGIAGFDENSQPTEKGVCDVDNGECDHICIAENDGRVCKCKFGYFLDSDNTSCLAEPLKENFLLVTDLTHARIYQIALQNGNVRTLDLPLVERPVTVRCDSTSKYLYWTEANSGKIMRATMGGKDLTIIYSSEFGTYPSGIELEQSDEYLYFTVTDTLPSNRGYVGVIDTSNLNRKTLHRDLLYVDGLALYPSKGIMFFTTYDGNSTYIYRAPMDGSSKSIWFSTKNTIYDLVIDYQGDRLYWSMYNELWSSDVSGLNRNLITTAKLNIRCILSAYPYLYYGSNDKQLITKFDISRKQSVTWMSSTPEIGYLISLDIYPKGPIPVNSLCADRNGLCSTFCLPKDTSKTCSCQDGVSLSKDGKTCSGVTKCSGKVQFGSLEDNCQGYSGETCSFTCDSGYSSSVQPQAVTCQKNGTWNPDLSALCSDFCETYIPNGGFKDCTLVKAGDSCDFYCDDEYEKQIKSNIICTATGTWSTQLDSLCVIPDASSAAVDDIPTTPIIAGASVAGIVVIAVTVVVITKLLRRKRPTRNDNERDIPVYFTAQSRNQVPITSGRIPQLPPSYAESECSKQQLSVPMHTMTGNPYISLSTGPEHIYEEVGAMAFTSSTYLQVQGSSSFAESPYMEADNAGNYTSLMPPKK